MKPIERPRTNKPLRAPMEINSSASSLGKRKEKKYGLRKNTTQRMFHTVQAMKCKPIRYNRELV